MPSAMANSALPPSTMSPEREISSSAPASGADTHGLTITAESTPIAATGTRRPPFSRPCVACRRCCTACGRRSSYSPNIDSASSTKMAANAPSTQTFCR